jgi:hypothetical protein
VGRLVRGASRRAKHLVQGFASHSLGSARCFSRPTTQEDDNPPAAVDHGDFLTDARQQLERTESQSAKHLNQFFVLIDLRRHINSRNPCPQDIRSQRAFENWSMTQLACRL